MRVALRRWRRLAALIGSLLLCLPPHLLWKLFGVPSPWPSRFLSMAARAVGARVKTAGKRAQGHVFFAANHLSWIDILAMGGATGTAFIAHDGIEGWPVVGWLAAQNNTIFVARTDRRSVSTQVSAVREALAGHQPVTLFPEGTTSDGHALLPFKPALFAVLTPPPRDLLIQPVHIDYGPDAAAIAWFGDEPPGTNAWRIMARKGPLLVVVRLLEPFHPADFPDRKAVAAEARRRIEASIASTVALPPSACPPAAV